MIPMKPESYVTHVTSAGGNIDRGPGAVVVSVPNLPQLHTACIPPEGCFRRALIQRGGGNWPDETRQPRRVAASEGANSTGGSPPEDKRADPLSNPALCQPLPYRERLFRWSEMRMRQGRSTHAVRAGGRLVPGVPGCGLVGAASATTLTSAAALLGVQALNLPMREATLAPGLLVLGVGFAGQALGMLSAAASIK